MLLPGTKRRFKHVHFVQVGLVENKVKDHRRSRHGQLVAVLACREHSDAVHTVAQMIRRQLLKVKIRRLVRAGRQLNGRLDVSVGFAGGEGDGAGSARGQDIRHFSLFVKHSTRYALVDGLNSLYCFSIGKHLEGS